MKFSRQPYVILGLVIILGGGLMAGCSFRNDIKQNEASESGSELVTLDGDQVVTLALDNRVGEITILSGGSREIRVNYTKFAYAESKTKAQDKLSQIEIKLEQDGDRVRVYTIDSSPRDHSQSNKVDFEITVPETINLNVKQDVGDIRVEDIQAPDTLRVESKVGQITLSDVQAPDSMKLSTDTGEIDFEGTLAGDGAISTKVGAIRVELPQDAALEVNAQTKVGKVTVSDFDTRNVQNERVVVSERWRGTLGQGEASAELILKADTGDISISAG